MSNYRTAGKKRRVKDVDYFEFNRVGKTQVASVKSKMGKKVLSNQEDFLIRDLEAEGKTILSNKRTKIRRNARVVRSNKGMAVRRKVKALEFA